MQQKKYKPYSTKPQQNYSLLTLHQRYAPCRGHIHEFCPSFLTPSSHFPPHQVENKCCDPNLYNLPPA